MLRLAYPGRDLYEQAAAEMRRRVDALAPGKGRSVGISPSIIRRAVLRIEAKTLSLDPSFLYMTAPTKRTS